MNRKVITVIVVAVVAVCVLVVVYSPNIMEAILRMHRIPQH